MPMNAPLTYLYRDLARRLEHIEELKVKNNSLLQALKDVVTSRNLDLNESARVIDCINKCDLGDQDTSSMTPSTGTDDDFGKLKADSRGR
ncbi:hypothetical protein LTR55_011972, partial [Exophiala xenobiotica]